jgi:predicted nucleic-acid-binding protein
MATFDTNVVVRIIVKDDPEQCLLAEGVWRSAIESGGVFLPKIVIVEVAWVPRSAYRYDRLAVAGALRGLTEVEGVRVEDEDEIRRASGSYDWTVERQGTRIDVEVKQKAALGTAGHRIEWFRKGFSLLPRGTSCGSIGGQARAGRATRD